MIVGLIAVILVNGLGFFWPDPLVKVTLKDGSVFLGEVVDREPIPQPGTPEHNKRTASSSRSATATCSASTSSGSTRTRSRPASSRGDVVYVERREYGPLLGTPVRLIDAATRWWPRAARRSWTARPALPATSARARPRRRCARSSGTRSATSTTASSRRASDAAQAGAGGGARPAGDLAARRAELERRVAEQQERYQAEAGGAGSGWSRPTSRHLRHRRHRGRPGEGAAHARRLPRLPPQPADVVGPAAASTPRRLWEFVSGDPRESNTEGGIFPAIFGTVMMVHPHERGRGALRGAGRALPARVRAAGAARAHRAHRRQQPGRRALHRLRRLRPRLLRLLRGRRHRPRCSTRRRCPPRPSARAGSSGPR